MMNGIEWAMKNDEWKYEISTNGNEQWMKKMVKRVVYGIKWQMQMKKRENRDK